MKAEVTLALFVEVNTEIRARRTAEYTYTAAAIAAFGALAWGVASLGSNPSNPPKAPVEYAVAGIAGLAAAVLWKNWDEHKKHFKFRKESVRIAALVAKSHGIELKSLPTAYQEPVKPGAGHLWSASILMAGALGAATFCLSIGFPGSTACLGSIGLIVSLLCLVAMALRDKHLS